jgi:hypothetical protein
MSEDSRVAVLLPYPSIKQKIWVSLSFPGSFKRELIFLLLNSVQRRDPTFDGKTKHS